MSIGKKPGSPRSFCVKTVVSGVPIAPLASKLIPVILFDMSPDECWDKLVLKKLKLLSYQLFKN